VRADTTDGVRVARAAGIAGERVARTGGGGLGGLNSAMKLLGLFLGTSRNTDSTARVRPT